MHPLHFATTAAGTAWTLSNDFGYVVIVGVFIGLELLLIGFLIPGGARKVFTKEFME